MLLLFSITVILWALGWLLLLKLSKPATEQPQALNNGKLSLIIPARNEQHNLPRLLTSIISQTAQPLEIIVVDDHSTDNTAQLAREAGAMVIPSKPLPDGWRGKTWACHQGAQVAKGELLCFLDADTWFEPDGLNAILSQYDRGALSICPWHATEKPYESLSLFFNLAMIVGTTPHGLFGQMLLVDQHGYQQAGGHKAVRGKVLENAHLVQNFQSNGITTHSTTGRNLLSFRMYPGGLSELVEGWTKGFASGAQRTHPLVMLTLIAWMSGLVLTTIGLVLSYQQFHWWILYGLCVTQLAWLCRSAGRFHPLLIILYPIPLLFFFGLFTWSAIKGGKNVSWKGRQIHAD